MSESDRKSFHLDPNEARRRRKLLDGMLKEHGLDAAIVQGSCNAVGLAGHYMWLTGISPFGSYPQTAIYWRDAPMTVIRHGAFNQSVKADPENPETLGIGKVCGTPTFPGVGYTLRYDAEIAGREVKDRRAQRIGLISPGTMYHGFGEVLRRELAGCEFVDLTDEIDLHKAIKSPYEIELVRQAAAMQDVVLRKIGNHVQPGMRDCEVMAYANLIAEQHGASGTGIFLGSSLAPEDAGLPIRYRGEQGRTIRDGDLFFLLVENAGGSGMYTHVSRYFSLGTPPQELVDLLGTVIEAQTYTCELLVPGANPATVFDAYNAYLEKRGFGREARLHAHGQGIDLVERPLIRSDETMPLANGMNIGVHPMLKTSSRIVTMCDNFLITPGGAERLHKFPQTIVDLR